MTDRGTILSLIKGAKERSLDIFFWKMIGDTKMMGQIKIDFVRKSKNDFSISPLEGQQQVIREILGSQDMVDVYIPELHLLFRTKINKPCHSQKYYLKLPEYVALVERRKSFRINTYNQGEIEINVFKSDNSLRTQQQQFRKKCYDVSAGGFSFLVSKMEHRFFKKNDSLCNVDLLTKNKSIKSHAKIIDVYEVAPDEFNNFHYKVWRVSCRFTKIDDLSKKYLEKFVFERLKEDLSVINE